MEDTRKVVVPANEEINISIGSIFSFGKFIETFCDIEDQFSVNSYNGSQSNCDNKKFSNGYYKEDINVVIENIDFDSLVQSGSNDLDTILIEKELRRVTLRGNFPVAQSSDLISAGTYLAVKIVGSDEVFGSVFSSEQVDSSNTVYLDFSNWSVAEINHINMPIEANWNGNISALMGEMPVRLSDPFRSPFNRSNVFTLYTPAEHLFDEYLIQLFGTSSAIGIRPAFSFYSSEIPQELNSPTFEVSSIDTDSERIIYQMDRSFGFVVSQLSFNEPNVTWAFYHDDTDRINQVIPDLPESVLREFPDLQEAIASPRYLHVGVRKYDTPNFNYIMDNDNNFIFSGCLEYSSGSEMIRL